MELERFQCPECDAVSSQNTSCESCNTGVDHLHRCAWCVQWSPTDDYCVHCGSVMIPAEKFYAARVLKQQGVNQLSISIDLDKIDNSQLVQYQQQFEKQNGLIESIIGAVSECQDLLYFKSYVDEFSRRLIKSLPLSPEDEKRYEDLFANMPESPAERLLILSASQQCPDLMQIAQLLRGGRKSAFLIGHRRSF